MPKETPKFINPEKLAALPPLPPQWVQRMEVERGWTPEGIAAADLRLWTSEFGQERIAIPIPDGEGRLPNIRLYLPGAKGKQLKMVNWYEGPKDARVTYGGDLLWPHPSTWVDGPVWLVEGEPDRTAGLSKRLPGNVVTRTGGARSWKDEWTEYFRDRDVILLMDADKTGLAGTEKVAGELLGVAARIRAVLWPEEMWKNTPHPLLDTNKLLTDYSEFIQEYGAGYPANHGEDLTDYFHKHAHPLDDLLALLDDPARCLEYEPDPGQDLPPEDRESENTSDADEDESPALRQIRRLYFVWQSGWKFKPPLLRDAILAERKFLADPLTKQLYEYEGRYWRLSSVDYVESLAAEKLAIEAESARVANVGRLVYLKSLLGSDRKINEHMNLICLQNGMLDISDGPSGGTLHPHAPDYLATQILPFAFDPKADCPVWKKALDDYWFSDSVKLQLQQYFGYCMTRETKYAKCLLLKGDGNDGKTKVLDVLRALVGVENCSAVQMSRLEDPFERATIYGKLLNLSTEENKGVFGSAYFKAIVTGDFINASFKHKDFFQFQPYCKLVFASNFFPSVSDSSDGFYRRILPIRFTRQFTKADEDKDILAKFMAELPGIFNWALAGLVSLREHDGFVMSEESQMFLGEYKRHNNPVLSLVQEWCRLAEEGEDLRTGTDDMYEAYKKYCAKYGYKTMQSNNFGETLRQVAKVKTGRLLKHQCAPGTPDDEKKRPRCYIGIEILPEFRVAPPAPPPAAGPLYSWA